MVFAKTKSIPTAVLFSIHYRIISKTPQYPGRVYYPICLKHNSLSAQIEVDVHNVDYVRSKSTQCFNFFPETS